MASIIRTGDALPTQTGQSGKVLSTNGTSPSWTTLPSGLPTQTGQAGKYLQTDGTAASWEALSIGEPAAWWVHVTSTNGTQAAPVDITYDKATGRAFVCSDVDAASNTKVAVTCIASSGSIEWHREITYSVTGASAYKIAHVRGHVYLAWYDNTDGLFYVSLLDDSDGSVIGTWEAPDEVKGFAAVQDHVLAIAGYGPMYSALLHPEPATTFPLDITASGGSTDNGYVTINDGGFYVIVKSSAPTSTAVYRLRSIANDALDTDNWTLVFTCDLSLNVAAGGDGNFYAYDIDRIVCYSKTGTLLWTRQNDPSYIVGVRFLVPSPDGVCVIDRKTSGNDQAYVTRLTAAGQPLRAYVMTGFTDGTLLTNVDYRVYGGVCLDDSIILLGRTSNIGFDDRMTIAHVPFKPRIEIQATVSDEITLTWADHSTASGFSAWTTETDPTATSGVTFGIAAGTAAYVTTGPTVTVSTGAVEATIATGGWTNVP